MNRVEEGLWQGGLSREGFGGNVGRPELRGRGLLREMAVVAAE